MAWLLCGVLAAAYLIVKIRVLPPKILFFLFLSLIFSYVLSAAIHGARLEGWMSAIKPLVILSLIIALYNADPDVEETTWVAGLVAAVTGAMAFCGFLPLPSVMTYGRLHGLFQYANALALFLAVCALVTRLSEKRTRLVSLMETVLFLTLSVGGIAVYFGGWLLAYITNRQIRPIFRLQLPSILTAGLCAALMFVLAHWTTPYFAVLPPIGLWFIHKPLAHLPKPKWLLWVTTGLAFALTVVLFATRGIDPLLTYVSRLIQMSDGMKALWQNPFGIGPGAWAFEVHTWQSTFYEATQIHSGFVSAGVDAGWPVLGLCAVLIVWYFRQRPFPKYGAAVGMILFHALFDISLSFLSVVLLLGLFVVSERPGWTPNRRFRTAWAIPCLLCLFLAWPQAIKNQAKWAADEGKYTDAATLLETPLLRRDTQAQLLRLRYALADEQRGAVDQSLEALGDRNTDACYMMALDCLWQGDFNKAAQWIEVYIQSAPYVLSGYTLAEEVMMKMEEESRDAFSERIDQLKTRALAQMHPWTKYIQSEQGLR